MKAGDINDNLCRLLRFLRIKESEWHLYMPQTPQGGFSAQDLFKVYGRVLDYYGCPPNGLSRLFLYADAYAEIENWVQRATPPPAILYQHKAINDRIDNGGQIIQTIHPAMIGISYDGYYWDIEKIETEQP